MATASTTATDTAALEPTRTWHPLRHLMRAAWIQSIRRNEVYVVAILLLLYLMGALLLRIVGVDSAQTARFVAGLGLELGSMLSAALVIAIGARQVPVEIEQRTLYPVLAKPVSRGQFLLGKALPVWLLGLLAMTLFLLVTVLVVPGQPAQSPLVLAQAFAAKAVALALLTALVFWLSLWMPPSLAMLLAAGLAFLGAIAINWLAGQPGIGALAGCLPDLKLFEQFGRYVDGGPAIDAGVFARLLGYGALWTGMFATAAALAFRRKPL